MKRALLVLLLLFSITTFAQQGLNYKTVIKDGDGVILNNTPIPQVRFIILDGGINVYEEIHTTTTDANGIVVLNIGEGATVSGDFSALDWSSTNRELNVKIDTGDGLQDMGTTAFKKVPNGLQPNTAKTETDLTGGINQVYLDALEARTLALETSAIYEVNTYYAELGGYVIEVSDGGTRGLVVAAQDQGNDKDWNDISYNLLNKAVNHTTDGAQFKDWRLPTKWELEVMHTLYNASLCEICNIDGMYLDGTVYASSTENSSDSEEVWVLNFAYGRSFLTDKSNTNTVRAVRTFPKKYQVNTYYAELGGYVIEASDGGTKGLVTATKDQGYGKAWKDISDNLLNKAVNHNTDGARFKDWRLPTKRELQLMYTNYSNSLCDNCNKGANLDGTVYTSSTENNSNSEEVWVLNFGYGVTFLTVKSNANNVRAVRAFPKKYQVDTYYAELGGYVIEVSDGGTKGLVTATQDQGYRKEWKDISDNLLNKAVNHNTDGAQFKDWRLPTKRELNLMYMNYYRSLCIDCNEGANLAGTVYWSSTEANDNYTWVQFFSNGSQDDVNKFNTSSSVRAVRDFPKRYRINTYYPWLGGYVIEINKAGTHGVVAAMQDQGVSNWYTANDLVSNAANHDINGAKFKDWRLPSRRELDHMYRQRINIGGFVLIYNNQQRYWSSGDYRRKGDGQSFNNGYQGSYYKDSPGHVRAVRAF